MHTSVSQFPSHVDEEPPKTNNYELDTYIEDIAVKRAQHFCEAKRNEAVI